MIRSGDVDRMAADRASRDEPRAVRQIRQFHGETIEDERAPNAVSAVRNERVRSEQNTTAR